MKTKALIYGISGLALALSMSSAIAVPVSTTTIFDDQFNRSGGNTVGNSWSEINEQASDVKITGNALKLSGQATDSTATVASPDAAVTHTISTVGYQNVAVQFSWAALTASDATDFLGVAWKKSSDSTYTYLYSFALGGDGTYSTASFNLGSLADNTSIDLRFWTNVDEDNEGATIDWVTVSATSIPATTQSSAVPEPATFALLGIGLLCAGVARRRKS